MQTTSFSSEVVTGDVQEEGASRRARKWRRGGELVVPSIFALVLGCTAPAAATLSEAGPPVYVYRLAANGDTGFTYVEPSLFNADPNAFDVATPPASALLGNSSTYGGSLATSTDLTQAANQLVGTTLLTCTTTAVFEYTNTPDCDAAAGSTATAVNEFAAVQSWPFFVDSGTASNVNNGTFTFETTSDDGSWLVLGPASFTYAQPANFQHATGLTAGTAVVNNGYTQSATSRTGTAAITAGAAGSTCASNLYWLTWEYFEVEGGQSSIEYSWQLPGAGALSAPTQAVVYGQVTKSGTGKSGETVSASVNGGAATTLTTDVNGCYGLNVASSTAAQSISLTAKDTASGQTQTQIVSLASGNALVQNFAFPLGPPSVSLYKRITKVVTGGITVVPTPDPTNPTGVLGTSNYAAGVVSGSAITYTIYFANVGTLQAQGATSAVGPTFSDAIPANTTLVAGSPAFSCCTYPTATTTATLTTGTSVVYTMNAPLAPLTVAGAVQGNFSFSVTVK